MKTITFEDLIKLGVKHVTVIIDGYQTKEIFSHWEPFQREWKVKFNLKLYRGACYSLENQSTYLFLFHSILVYGSYLFFVV